MSHKGEKKILLKINYKMKICLNEVEIEKTPNK